MNNYIRCLDCQRAYYADTTQEQETMSINCILRGCDKYGNDGYY